MSGSLVDHYAEAAYILTLDKCRDATLEERTLAFFRFLRNHVKENEKLDCNDGCFTIEGKWYTITYTVEAYKKNADLRCFMAGPERPQVQFLHRIGCERAFRWIKDNAGKRNSTYYEITDRLFFDEMVREYPNPADRFCASLNITKALRKDKLDIEYGSFQGFGAQVMFHLLPSHFCLMPGERCRDTISALKLGETLATFVLPFVKEEYPDISGRYYLTDNHIPFDMMERIKTRIENARDKIYAGEDLAFLEPYLKNANFHAMDKNEEYDYEHTPEELKELIYKYRLSIAHLYDIFVRWTDSQLCDSDDLFNITGP